MRRSFKEKSTRWITSSGMKYGESVSDKIWVNGNCSMTEWRKFERVIIGVKPNLISVKYEVNKCTSSIVPTKQCKWILWFDWRY